MNDENNNIDQRKNTPSSRNNLEKETLSNVKKPRRYNPMQNNNMQDEKEGNINSSLPLKNDGLQDNNISSKDKQINADVDLAASQGRLGNNQPLSMNNDYGNGQQNKSRRRSNNIINDPINNVINNKLNKLRKNGNQKDDNKQEHNKNIPEEKKELETKNKIANAIGAAKSVNEVVQNTQEEEKSVVEAATDLAKEQAAQKAKQAFRAKIKAFILKFIVPILPYIGVALLLLLILLVILFVIINIFGDEDITIQNIYVNYCEKVHVMWEEEEEIEDEIDPNFPNRPRNKRTIIVKKEDTVTYKEYIEYLMSLKDYSYIDNEEVLKSLAIIFRTNFMVNANNMENNTCEYELDQPFYKNENLAIHNAVSDTKNKVFTTDSTILNELGVDDNFTYYKVVSSSSGEMYKLYQDGMSYNKDWIDSHVLESLIVEGSTNQYSFSPYAAWYLQENGEENFHSLLYHFYDPISTEGDIYNAVKIGGSEDVYGSNFCSDISLTSTSLSKEEFINYVNQNVSNQTFRNNAEKIYDISISNNFNPEMVVVRAISEGFSPGESKNNYWGLGCSNTGGYDACISYSSFDAGVIGFINNIKGHNYATAYQMMMSYAYIGSYWYNPGSSSKGGCYYFPYIKQYLSETRALEVESACSSSPCDGSSCLKTTDEDQSAYAKWQVSKMGQSFAAVFGPQIDKCSEEKSVVATGDMSTLGARAAQYAISTYDSWQYSQANRNQDGYVDCSSMVSRAYSHYGVRIYNSSNSSAEIYRWCENNGKVVSSSELQAGDLIFYNHGSYKNSSYYKGIGHVDMYIGGNQTFGAHGSYEDSSNDVRVDSYKNNGDFYCRPSK